MEGRQLLHLHASLLPSQRAPGAVDWSTPRQISLFAAFPADLQLALAHAAALGVLVPPVGMSSWLDCAPSSQLPSLEIDTSSATTPANIIYAGLLYSGTRFEVGARLAFEYITLSFASKVAVRDHTLKYAHPTMEHYRTSPHQPLLTAQPWQILRQLQAACNAAHLFGVGPRPPTGTPGDPYPDALRAAPAAAVTTEFNLAVVPLGCLVTWIINELSVDQIAVVHHLYKTLTPLHFIQDIRAQMRELQRGAADAAAAAATAPATSAASGATPVAVLRPNATAGGAVASACTVPAPAVKKVMPQGSAAPKAVRGDGSRSSAGSASASAPVAAAAPLPGSRPAACPVSAAHGDVLSAAQVRSTLCCSAPGPCQLPPSLLSMQTDAAIVSKRRNATIVALVNGTPPTPRGFGAQWRPLQPESEAATMAAKTARTLCAMDADAAAAVEIEARAADRLRTYPIGLYDAATRGVVFSRGELARLLPTVRGTSCAASGTARVVLISHRDVVAAADVARARSYDATLAVIVARLAGGGSPADLAHANAPRLLSPRPLPDPSVHRPFRVLSTCSIGPSRAHDGRPDVDENLRFCDTSSVMLCQCGCLSCYRLQRELRGVSPHSPGSALGPEGDAFLGHLVRVAWAPLDGILARRAVPCVNEQFTSPAVLQVNWQAANAESMRLDLVEDALKQGGGAAQGGAAWDKYNLERARSAARWVQLKTILGWQRSALNVRSLLEGDAVLGQRIPQLVCDVRTAASLLPCSWGQLAAELAVVVKRSALELLAGQAVLEASRVRAARGVVAQLVAAGPPLASQRCPVPLVVLAACVAEGESPADATQPPPCAHCTPSLFAKTRAAARLPFGSASHGSLNSSGRRDAGLCADSNAPLLDTLRRQIEATQSLGCAGAATVSALTYDAPLHFLTQPWAAGGGHIDVSL